MHHLTLFNSMKAAEPIYYPVSIHKTVLLSRNSGADLYVSKVDGTIKNQSVYCSPRNLEKRMSVIGLPRTSKMWTALAICLLALPLGAQPGGETQSSQQDTQTPNTQPTAAQQQSATPGQTPSAPEPKHLPSPTGVDYSQPVHFLPNPIRIYLPRTVPPPVLTNAPRIEELLQNGKVMLSMDDAIALALADNLDIAIARYNLSIADTDILLTHAGASPRGVNAGVVQGTPGGGVGGICAGAQGAGAGGTSAGA